MMKKFYFLVFSLLVLSVAQSQVTIFSENMGTPVSTTVVSAYTGWQNGSPITFSSGSPEVDVRTSSASSGYTGASGGGNVFITSATGRFLEIAGINTVGYTNIALSLGHFKSTTAGNNELTIEVSEDGISYSALTYSRATGSGTANWILLNPSGTIPATANLRIRFTQTSTTTQFRIDDVVLTGNSGACSGVPSGQAGFGVITPSFNEAEINVSAGTGGTGRVVKVNTTNSFANMVDGDDPAANTVYSSGEQVVYNGTGTGPFTVTGLSASTTYYVAVYEYNCGTGRFYLNPGATTSFATTAVPSLGLQLTTINTAVLIDFDNTLAGVNEGQFAGSGFTPTPSAGQLNSNAWATTGMSDGASAFGATSVSGDHARGTSPGGVTTGGFYAFETSAGNRGLGVQATGSDWAPGTITLKVQNNTGVLLNSVDVGYLIWVLNDQGRSNSFNFSYSTDDITYTAVGALDYTSTDAADGSPAWASVSRSTNLPLVIPIGGYFYLRWSGADVGGSGSRDEFAIDDIEITGNATQIPTPVKFSNVKAYAEGNAIRIDWSNLTETDVN
ncbi:MAG TPA: hypothetical protein PLU37_15625, partial [Chitinophagaceae bacterium]|nr:hypothetical protein [Chitinophagaceae bacterium]